MKILFLHGWQSAPRGVKPTYLALHGHTVLNPRLPDDDFSQAVCVAQAEFDEHRPELVVGSSRGGAVAMNIDSGDTPLVLLCPAWKRWGSAVKVKPQTTILHSRADEVVPFADSLQLAQNSRLPKWALIEVGRDHRLADRESLRRMLEICEQSAHWQQVTVYYLEMRRPPQRSIPAPCDGLTVFHVQRPSVPYYRFLYDTVGGDYHWLSRRRLSDEQLAAVIGHPQNELHVLHVEGSPAGFAELDRRQPQEIELVQFGLMPEFIGRGLGRWFLQWTIEKAFSYRPERFWLHTCTLDHPAALPTYLGAGFVEYRRETLVRPF